jgi:hypothetical protein
MSLPRLWRDQCRFADDLGILIDAYPRHDWLMAAVEKRLREELADLQVEINKEKSRIVDLGRGGSFGFLGFDFRRIRSRRGAWRANYTPQPNDATAEAQGCVSPPPIAASGSGCAVDQPDTTRLGELLCGGAFQRVLQLHTGLAAVAA